MQRTLDPTNFNTVCNHPEVRPWLAGEGTLDVSDHITNPYNFAFEIDGGGYILLNQGNGLYEVHSQFVPEARRYSMRVMRDAMDYVFTRTDCIALITQLPDNNPAATSLARKGGFKEWFRREETPLGPSEFAGLHIAEWAAANADLEADGEWFHQRCAEALAVARPDLPEHPEDKVHDRIVGAAVRMFRKGNSEKAALFYNQWAHENGYPPIALLTSNPPLIDMSEDGLTFLVEVRDGNMDVLVCR